jgi:hypothetical protein
MVFNGFQWFSIDFIKQMSVDESPRDEGHGAQIPAGTRYLVGRG